MDTGSPVTIVAAKFLFQALSKHRLPDQTVEEWKDSVRARLQNSSMNLKSYGGGRLNIIGQIEVRLERGSNQTKAVVQIQKEAPVQTHWHRLTFFSWGAIPIERTKDASERDTI